MNVRERMLLRERRGRTGTRGGYEMVAVKQRHTRCKTLSQFISHTPLVACKIIAQSMYLWGVGGQIPFKFIHKNIFSSQQFYRRHLHEKPSIVASAWTKKRLNSGNPTGICTGMLSENELLNERV